MIAAEYWRPLPLPWGDIPQYPHVDCTPKKKTPIIATRLSDGAVFEYSSQAEAAAATGAFQANIHHVANGKRKSTNGFAFAYKEVVPDATDDY